MEKKDIESLDLTFEKGFDLAVDSILTQFLFKTIPSKQLSIKGLLKLSQNSESLDIILNVSQEDS